MALRSLIEQTILPFVAKPNRYIGNFVDTRPDRFAEARLRVAVVHPELFETGLQDKETRSAYAVLNATSGVAADLAFLPWPDLAARLKERRVPLWGLESFEDLARFDLILFTPASAIAGVSMLRILALSGVALQSFERGPDAPIVAALGVPMGNPAPLGPFLEAVFLGEPEAVLPRAASALVAAQGASRADRVAALRGLPGTIVLSAEGSGPDSNPAKTAAGFAPPIRAAVASLDRVDPPDPGLLPLIEAGHDGLSLEIRRGGTPLRFLSGWRSFAPAWEMAVETAVERAERGLAETGFDRIDLTGDEPWRHKKLLFLTESLVRRHPGARVALADFGVSEPGPALAREMLRGRRAVFGWSPLAGSDRLRRVLNLEFDEAAFLEAVGVVLRGGCHMIRLHFGIGWPTETAADLEALGDLVRRVRALKGTGSAPRIQVHLQPFVPRPHSPFQWEGQAGREELSRRVETIRQDIEHGPVQVKVSPPDLAILEAVVARGGPEIARLLVEALARGASTPNPFETWNSTPWFEALAAAGISIEAAVAERPLDRELPWSGIEATLPDPVLREERARGLAGDLSSPALLDPAARRILTEVAPVVVQASASRPAPAADVSFGRTSRRKAPAGAPRQASRFRIHFAKGEEVRFTAHLDVARAFERALRRLSMAPGALRGRAFKLSFGPPLPLGMTGEDEYLDLTFTDDVPETALAALGDLLPRGLVVREVRPIRASVESLCQAIDTATYRVSFPDTIPEVAASPTSFRARLEQAVARALALPEILVPKSADDEIHRVDARPMLLSARVTAGLDGGTTLTLTLAMGSPGHVKLEALLPALTGGIDPRLARIHRLELRISGAGKNFSPLEVVELDFPWWRETLRKRAAGQRP